MAERKTRKIITGDISKAVNDYLYVTIYRDTRQRDFAENPIANELARAIFEIPGCYRVYMVGMRTALIIGSEFIDCAIIRNVLARAGFTCYPVDPAENDPAKIMEKILVLYGPDL